MLEIVKDKIMYQATNWDYKIGQKIYFGRKRNFQAVRAFEKENIMQNGENAMLFLSNRAQNNKLVNLYELKQLNEAMLSYAYSLREIGMEWCRKKFYPTLPSRLTCMYLCEKESEAKGYLATAQTKNNNGTPKVIKVKLNGKLFKTSNKFNRRDLTFDGFVKNAHLYWQGVDKKFNEPTTEFLFEGWAEIVDIITY